MAEELKGRTLGGNGKVAEVDSGYFGGYVKPANMKQHRRDRRFSENQSGKRKAVVVIRERNGNSLPAVFRTEGQALSFIRSRITKGTIVNADESANRKEAKDLAAQMKHVESVIQLLEPGFNVRSIDRIMPRFPASAMMRFLVGTGSRSAQNRPATTLSKRVAIRLRGAPG
jgi:ISXO2 transposase-like protein